MDICKIILCIHWCQLFLVSKNYSWHVWFSVVLGSHGRWWLVATADSHQMSQPDGTTGMYKFIFIFILLFIFRSFSNSNFICNFKELLTTQITLIFCDYNICVTPKSSLSKSISQWTLNESCFGSLNRPLRSGTSLFLLMYPSNFTTGFSP